MKTLHEIYDAIYVANATGSDECVMSLTPKEMEALCNAMEKKTPSNLGGELIEVEDCADLSPWLVPKYIDGNKAGYVLGVNLSCIFKLTGFDKKSIIKSCHAEISCCTSREKWKPRLYKTIQAAINDCPSTAENITLWTH